MLNFYKFNIFLLLLAFSFKPALAYLDTTPKSFNKPKPMKIQAYKYKQSQTDKYAEIVTDQLAPRILSTVVGGPAAAVINITDKAIEYNEKRKQQP